MRSTESQELFMIYLESHQQLSSGSEALVEDFQSLDGLSVYACGSPEMIHDARTLLVSNGLQENRFYSDVFLASAN